VHPVRPADDWVSLRQQAGAADDALMRRLHGRDWRRRAGTGRGRFRWHVATVAAAAATAGFAAAGRRRAALAAGVCWLVLTVDFLRRRISPGPALSTPEGVAELRRMALTSPLIPFAALWHRVRGMVAHRRTPHWPPPLRAVLFDRDGTLVHDEPYNSNPDLVAPVDGARDVVVGLRRRGLAVAVVSNQSGVGRGLLTPEQVSAVNARVDAALGPFDSWRICPHAPEDGCLCRKPGPGLVLRAARDLRVAGYECAVIGDIGADVEAAIAAGARPILVPTAVTRPDEIAAAPDTADSLAGAVDLLIRAARVEHADGPGGR
jgi:histidinol-phosphate phosphatase family protein